MLAILATNASTVKKSIQTVKLSDATEKIVNNCHIPHVLNKKNIFLNQINLPSHIVSFLGLVTDDLEAEILSKMTKEPGGLWQCTVCLYKSKKKIHVSEHVEAKHVSHPGYQCSNCLGVYPNRKALRGHRKKCQ